MKIAVNTVTLRAQSPAKIVSILQEHEISAVEWAGDVHVPPGDLENATCVKGICDAAGITCTSYGSYYQCDDGGPGGGPFQYDLGANVALETAKVLGVAAIRVWAGRKGSATAPAEYRQEVARCLRAFCDRAASHGMTVHLEFHRNTLTDTAQSTLALMEAVSRDNLYAYWQPRHGVDVAGNVADIEALGERLSNVHVFHWIFQADGTSIERLPLSEGKDRWQAYVKALRQLPGDRYAMMEFVRGDELSQFSEDVAVLHSLIG